MKSKLLGLAVACGTLLAVALPPAPAQSRGYQAAGYHAAGYQAAGHCAPGDYDCPQCRRSCPEAPPVERHFYYQQPYCREDRCSGDGELGIRTPSFRIPSLRLGLSFGSDCDHRPCVPCFPPPCCHVPAPPRAPLVSSVSAITVPQQAVAINPVMFGAAVHTAVAPQVYAPQMVLPPQQVTQAAAQAPAVPAQLRPQAAPEAPSCQGTPDAATIRLLMELLRAENNRNSTDAGQSAPAVSPSSAPASSAPAAQSNEQKLDELRRQVQELKALLNQR